MKNANKESAALKLIASSRPLTIGHRGYCGIAPENTLPSFQRALEAGADVIELDFRPSKDGVAMVIHDDTLDRTTDVRKRWARAGVKVADATAAEIRALDAGSWFDARFSGTHVPLLTEALQLIVGDGGTPLLERKSGDAASAVRLLRALDLVNRVIVISFDWAYLREFHELEPRQVLGALGPTTHLVGGVRPSGHTRRLGRVWLENLAATGAKIVVWNREVAGEAIRLAHQRGLRVWVYTVNEPRLARQLIDKGADGIITNRIGVIQNALNSSNPGAGS